MSDRIQELVSEAHTYFNETLTSAIVEMDQKSAIAFLNNNYGFPCAKMIERYLAVVTVLRSGVDG